MDSVTRLLSAAIHPLNVPVVENGKVISGYGVITPRMVSHLSCAIRSPFARLTGGVGSTGAYSSSTKNLYQDAFGTGIFSGKGLMDGRLFFSLMADKLPDEWVLSHDILEGEILRTAYAGDICFYESFPESSRAFFNRQHRWIRGDIQNLRFLLGKEKDLYQGFSRFKLWDNVRRAVTPVVQFLAFFYGFIDTGAACAVAVISMISLILPSVLRFFRALAANGISVLSRKFYAPVLSETTESLIQAGWTVITLPKLAFTSLFACAKSLWRMGISKQHLLDWTPSHTAFKNNVLTRFGGLIVPEIAAFFLLVCPCAFVRYFSVLFLLQLPLIILSEQPYAPPRRRRLSPQDKTELKHHLHDMLRFFGEYVTAAENYLPPDNVQFAPVFRICHRTSPTNIGLYLLSVVAARDFGMHDTTAMEQKLTATISTVERMKKYRGNLYNWYETRTLTVCDHPFLSAVDSGNFLCCLIALKECLRDYRSESDTLPELLRRIETLIANTRLEIFFNPRRKLFYIGLDENLRPTPSHYDLLMSESRMLSYCAVASRQVPYEHWNRLGRTMSTYADFAGAVAFSGTMFEFFMPELFLKSEVGSLCYESLRFALMCQIGKANDEGIPYGISESGYFAFDGDLNYQYKAHGVQRIGLRRDLNRELVVSPYSTYLSLSTAGKPAAENLRTLKRLGMYGVYGMYEAIDFTPGRCPPSGTIVKSYMAHHVGMSILGIANAIEKGRFQTAFLHDRQMSSARELLAEKPYTGGVYIEDITRREPKLSLEEHPEPTEGFAVFSPFAPRVKLMANGEYTLAAADVGSACAMFRGELVYAMPDSPLQTTRGAFCAVENSGAVTGFSYLPLLEQSDTRYTNFYENAVLYHCVNDEISANMEVRVHEMIPAELRKITLKNTGEYDRTVSLLTYLEPVLMHRVDFSAHPAFAKLFLEIQYDYADKFILVSRKNRASQERKYLGVGFVESCEPEFLFSREQVLRETGGGLSPFADKQKLHSGLNYIPDPCVFTKLSRNVPCGKELTLTLFFVCAESEEILREHVHALRTGVSGTGRVLALPSAESLSGRLMNRICADVLFSGTANEKISRAVTENTRMIYELGKYAIDANVPVVLAEADEGFDPHRISAYVQAHRYLRLCAVETQLVFVAHSPAAADNVSRLIAQNADSRIIRSDYRIFLLRAEELGLSMLTLLRASALHFSKAGQDLIREPAAPFVKIRIEPMKPVFSNQDLKTACGGFGEGKFLIDEKPPAPWCNILANEHFGTLLSSRSLGYTYAGNSRENKLTPWENDPISDNRGERLILRANGRYFDLIDGALCEFTPIRAVYTGENSLFSSRVVVRISAAGYAKRISVEIRPKARLSGMLCAFCCEPVLGVDRRNTRYCVPEITKHGILVSRPADCDSGGYMGVLCAENAQNLPENGGAFDYAFTSLEAFYAGNWEQSVVCHAVNPCAVLVKKPDEDGLQTEFLLTYGKTQEDALQPALALGEFDKPVWEFENSIRINTPMPAMNFLFNTWLFHQAYTGRMLARAGFYQCSGAFGFRDQLQDACAVMILNPTAARAHILQCCTAQFAEGDVLHWWHTLPDGKKRGVRTRISDDLLFLPYTLCEYLDKTADESILSEQVCFCEGLELIGDEQDLFGEVRPTHRRMSVYNHARFAIERAFQKGSHGLLLMGGGDWNDSFNAIGADGLGESVWLSQFMILVLKKFIRVCEQVNCSEHAIRFADMARDLEDAVQKSGWDGKWYARAFFGNGERLGSHISDVCEIDSLTQSFSVLAGLKNTNRQQMALDSAYARLVDEKSGIIRLFTPAFSHNSSLYAGYVNAYPEGIRENGGQYTHAAVWLAMAFLSAGRADEGARLVQMLLPYTKTKTRKQAEIYRCEPYFISADIYTNPQCTGRAGWSLYTGAAGWLYRCILENMLGIRIVGDAVYFTPCIPTDWDGFTAELRYRRTTIFLTVRCADNAYLYDNGIATDRVLLDGNHHSVEVSAGRIY